MTDREFLDKLQHLAATNCDMSRRALGLVGERNEALGLAADVGELNRRMLAELDSLKAERDQLRLEVEGLTKANALLNAGLGTVCESRDELKHAARERDTARALNLHLANRLCICSTLLGRCAEKGGLTGLDVEWFLGQLVPKGEAT